MTKAPAHRKTMGGSFLFTITVRLRTVEDADPYKDSFNFSDQGLGGPWELATAKASGALAPTVYSQTNNSTLLLLLGSF